MANPFDDPEGDFYALRNLAGQYSLWPGFRDIPEGWDIAHGPAAREDCLSHIEMAWTQMRR